MDDGLRMLEVGGCSAWVLPGDPTCAGVARRVYRRAAAALALEPAVVDDGVTMVSELAANTLHIQHGQPAENGQRLERDNREGAGDREEAGERGEREEREQLPWRRAAPELWLYLRGSGVHRELVCKVFDSFPGWLRGNVPGRTVGRAPADAVSGRGLEVVHELSHGHWGHHLTRSRLAGWDVRGKAVWFAVPAVAPTAPTAPTAPAPTAPAQAPALVPATAATLRAAAPGTAPGTARATAPGTAHATAPGTVHAGAPAGPLAAPIPRPAAPDRYAWMSAGQAMTELENDLAARGFGGRMVRADDPAADMAVLSVSTGVTVWCRAGVAWLRAPGLAGKQWRFCDLVEVAEQTVQAYETLAVKSESPQLAEASQTGALTRAPAHDRTAADRAIRGPRRATRTYAAPLPRSG